MQTDTIRGAPVSSGEETLVSERDGDTTSDDSSKVSIAGIFRVLRSNIRVIATVALTSFAISAIIAFLIPASYTSIASFIPPSSNNNSLSALAGQLSAVGAGAAFGAVKSNGDLYVGILSSSSIADAIISRFDLMGVYKVRKQSAAAKILASRSDFEAGLRDGIVTVKVTDRSPERARDIANAYLQELHTTNDRLALTEASQRRLFFEQQLAKEKDNLANAEVELKKVEEQTGLIAPAGQTTVQLETIAQTRAAIAVRQVQLAALRQSSTDQNPEVVRLRSEIADLQGQVAGLEHGSGQGDSDIPKSKVPELELQFVRQQREVKYHESLFEMIAKQYEEARLDESHDAPVLQVLDYAVLPDTKSGPHRLLIAAAGLVLGVLLGAAWVLLQNRDAFQLP
jgi:tyrosine-protein kinase Etk/Wzc